MKIKGFDKNLCCRGMQFEIGKIYDTGAKDDELRLCSNTVFHYCDNIQKVHEHYRVDEDNRFCEIEVLGREISDGEKCGSNKIRIVREITGDELNIMLGKINGNTGDRNTGYWNTGDRNTGDCNTGDWNTGDWNTGDCNTGYWNTGDRNTGDCNTGDCNTGDWNTGYWNTGYWNTGDRNTGDCNTGDCNTGYWNTGDRNTGDRNTGDRNTGYCNTGDRNTGDRNTGDCNTGIFNSCNYSTGVFCNKEEKIRIFNIQSEMTMNEFLESKYYRALYSAPFKLTEWVYYSENEKDTEDKKVLGGYLRRYTYKEACANWWENMTEENKKIIMSMPNFDKAVFYNITGIEV